VSCVCEAGGHGRGGSVASAAGSPGGRFGIRLLEAPVNRRDDPRALTYIVDHLAPGTTIRRHVEVSNSSNEPLLSEVYPAAAEVMNGTFGLAPGRTPNELSGWMSVDRPRVGLPAHSARQVLTTIRVPKNASAGERYAVIWAQVSSPKNRSHNVGVVHRVGVRVYLDVGSGGEPASDFRIETLTPTRTREGVPEVVARVRNTGKRALDMNGSLKLSDGPGSLRAGPFRATPGTTLAPGQSGSVTTVLGQSVPAGPWQAHMAMYSGKVKRSATATITFPAAGSGRPARPNPQLFTRVLLIGLGAAATLGLGTLLIRRRLRPAL
jgi:hypothetical protein